MTWWSLAGWYALACGLSWAIWLPLAATDTGDPLRSVLLVTGTFGPGLAAITLLVARHGRSGAWDEVRGLLR
ncbi:MAG: hypothetical protein AB1Z55_07925, partial [Acidimicrobiia bacterium]